MKRGPKPVAHPTEREIEILLMVYAGDENKEIGAKLEISPLTVKRHLFRLSKYLNVASRTRLVTLALEKGWIEIQKGDE